MDTLNLVSKNLRIPSSHCRRLSDDRIACIVSQTWFKNCQHGCFQSDSDTDTLDKGFAEEMLAESFDKIPSPWVKISVKILWKTSKLVKRPKWEPLCEDNVSDSLMEHLTKIAQQNLQSQWHSAFVRYKGRLPSSADCLEQELSEVLREYLLKFGSYIHVLKQSDVPNGTATTVVGEDTEVVHNVLEVRVVMESEEHFLLVQPYVQYTLRDALAYSPSLLAASHAKGLFLLFQLLHAMHHHHRRGLALHHLDSGQLLLDTTLWLHVLNPVLAMRDFLCPPGQGLGEGKANQLTDVEQGFQPTLPAKDKPVAFDTESICAIDADGRERKLTEMDELNSLDYVDDARRFLKSFHHGDFVLEELPSILHAWLTRKLTNFRYLMILNYLSGRRMGDPNNHPILPWVIDFSCPDGGYRDLTMSKHRLNKGDSQLDFLYSHLSADLAHSLTEEGGELAPHHVTDSFTELSYYVYKARRMSRALLLARVRPVWKPCQYPSSIQRQYETTPDECIPEFYTDPSVFVSLHPDMPDLEVPSWCSSPEDFLHKHMAALESEPVSEKLHHWIDLYFGCKLSGVAALAAKNVYRHMVNQHTDLMHSGPVQLFSQPHPSRLALSDALPPRPPKVYCAFHSQNTFLDECAEDNGTERNQNDKNTIFLPKNYNPLSELEHVELYHNFINKTLHHRLSPMQAGPLQWPQEEELDAVREDMVLLGCLICEMLLASKLQMQEPQTSLPWRYRHIMQACSPDFSELPKPFQHSVQLLLGGVMVKEDSEGKLKLLRKDSLSSHGLLPLTPSLLLSPHQDVLPFPSYFQDLYECLTKIRSLDLQIMQHKASNRSVAETGRLVKQLERQKVPVLERFFSRHQGALGAEGMDLVMPHAESLFANNLTAVQAAWTLFPVVSRELGPIRSSQLLKPYLAAQFSSQSTSSKHIRLYHRTFLQQLISRLSLQAFLSTFATLLVEAVAGYNDFPVPNKFYNEELLEEMEQEGEQDMGGDAAEEGNEGFWHGGVMQGQHRLEPTMFSEDDTNRSSTSWEACRDENTQEEVDEMDEDFADTMSFGEENNDPQDSDLDSAEQADDGNLSGPRSLTEVASLGQLSNTSDGGEGHQTAEVACSVDEVFSLDTEEGEKRRDRPEDGDAYSVQSVSEEDSEPDSLRATASSASLEPELDTQGTSPEMPAQFPSVEDGMEDQSVKTESGMVRSETDDYMLNLTSLPAQILNIRDVATESVKFLCHKLGPVLTAKHLTQNLIRMLALCYQGDEQFQPLSNLKSVSMKSSLLVVGDGNAEKLLECLGHVTVLYGEQVIHVHYLRRIEENINQLKAMGRGSGAGIGGMGGLGRGLGLKGSKQSTEGVPYASLVLLRFIIPYLSDKGLMDILEDHIVNNCLQPVVQRLTSAVELFPGGARRRLVLCHKFIDVLYVLGLRFGFEMTRKHLSQVMTQFLETFNLVYAAEIGQTSPVHTEREPPVLNPALSTSEDSYLNIKLDDSTHEYTIGTPVSMSGFSPAMAGWADQMGRSKPFEGAMSSVREEKGAEAAGSEACLQELAAVFTPELAMAAYIPFCRIFGSIHMENHLENDDLIRQLCSQQDQTSDQQTAPQPDLTFQPDSDSSAGSTPTVCGAIGSNVAVVGNKIQLAESQHSTLAGSPELSYFGRGYRHSGFLHIDPSDLDVAEMRQNIYKARHLRGNWLAYWEHELGLDSEREKSFNFKQIKLLSFVGHSNSVRSLHVMDTENAFISASKDKTVKLWSISCLGDGSGKMPCQWSYMQHRKSVFSVAYIESMRQVASCDSTVHVWDPFTGDFLARLDSPKYSPVVALVPLPAPSPVVVTATLEATLRFLDLRTAQYAQEYKCAIASAGLIRCVAVSPDGGWLAVGFSTGFISLMDARMGLLMSTWKAHDGEILQIKAPNRHHLVSSSFDQTMKLWNISDGREIGVIKGPSEPVPCFCFYQDQIISATTANRISIHSMEERIQESFTSTKLRSDVFKGVLTSMAVLPQNRSLLLGADNGSIRLVC